MFERILAVFGFNNFHTLTFFQKKIFVIKLLNAKIRVYTQTFFSKKKIKFKKKPIFQPNCLTKNIPSNDMSDNQSCQKKMSHEILHTVETNHKHHIKSFECSDCQFTSTKKSTYEDHLISKKHYINTNNIQPYLCQHCNINLSNKSNYLKHIKNIHNIAIDQLRYTGYYLIEHHDQKIKKNLKENDIEDTT